MNLNFNSAVGNLLAHFYRHHQIAITEPEVWLISNILQCTDDMFDAFDMISDIMGLSLDSEDHAAICHFEKALEVLHTARHPMEITNRYSLN